MKLRARIILVMIIAALFAAVIWIFPSNRDFGPNNTSWNGLGDFCSDFKPSEIESLGELPSSSKGSVLVLIPYTTITDTDLEKLKEYISDGGTLVILDDYGYGNEVLSYLDVTPRFSNDPLLDPLFNMVNSSFPRITDFELQLSSSEVESIVLNHASSLTDVSDQNVVAWSSRFSFLDENDNSIRDEGEPQGPFAVASAMNYESGHIALVSDPSILIMLDEDNNKQFVEDVLTLQDANPSIILDESHIPSSRLETTQEILDGIRSLLVTPQGITGLALAVGAVIMWPVWRRHRGLPTKKS